MCQTHIDELHQLTCERSRHPHRPPHLILAHLPQLYSVIDDEGYRDSEVYLLLNLAATMLNIRVDPPVDTTNVRTLLADFLAPQSGGFQYNFFNPSFAVAVPQDTDDDPPLACVSCRATHILVMGHWMLAVIPTHVAAAAA